MNRRESEPPVPARPAARPAPGAGSRRATPVINLQRTAGNRAVTSSIGQTGSGPIPIQRDLATEIAKASNTNTSDESVVGYALADAIGHASEESTNAVTRAAKSRFGASNSSTDKPTTKPTSSLTGTGASVGSTSTTATKLTDAELDEKIKSYEEGVPAGPKTERQLKEEKLKRLEAEDEKKTNSKALQEKLAALKKAKAGGFALTDDEKAEAEIKALEADKAKAAAERSKAEEDEAERKKIADAARKLFGTSDSRADLAKQMGSGTVYSDKVEQAVANPGKLTAARANKIESLKNSAKLHLKVMKSLSQGRGRA